MKVAAAYIRVSTDDQIEYSPDSQLKAIKNYAQKNNIYLPEQYIFVDEGISGRSIGKREGFKQMIALAKSKPRPYDVILVWKYSRFARNREDSVVYKSMLRRQCGISVVSISESTGDDKMSILFEAMIEAMDEYYSINLAEEVKRGMTEKAKRGGVLSIPPFGYKVENGKFVVVESEAEIIKNVFTSYMSGSGFLSLAKKLNNMGVRTHRGNLIENRTIEYWLNNPVYIGKIRWNPNGKTSRDYHNKNLIITDGEHQPIIDDELWNSVQKKLFENKERYKKNMRSPKPGMSHWLNGLLRCGICGHTLSNCAGFYYCSYKNKGKCKGNGCISTNVIEKLVIDKLNEILDNDNIHLEFSESDIKHTADNEDFDTRLLKTKLEEADRRLKRVKEAYENGIDTIEEYKKNKEKISNEIIAIKSEVTKLQNLKKNEKISKDVEQTEILKRDICKVSEILKSPSIDNSTKNSVLKSIIKEIIKTGDDGRTFNIIFWNPKKNST